MNVGPVFGRYIRTGRSRRSGWLWPVSRPVCFFTRRRRPATLPPRVRSADAKLWDFPYRPQFRPFGVLVEVLKRELTRRCVCVCVFVCVYGVCVCVCVWCVCVCVCVLLRTDRILTKIKHLENYVYKYWYGAIANAKLLDLDLLFRVKYFIVIISETLRASEKEIRHTVFVDFDIFNRTASSQKLYSVTLTYFFKVKYFKC